MKALARDLAERKVDSLSYTSFERLREYFRDRFNLEPCSTGEFEKIRNAIELRNISVHNRCRVNSRYVERTGLGAKRVGSVRLVGIDDLDDLAPVLYREVKQLDKAAAKKLKLRRKRFHVYDILRAEGEKEMERVKSMNEE